MASVPMIHGGSGINNISESTQAEGAYRAQFSQFLISFVAVTKMSIVLCEYLSDSVQVTRHEPARTRFRSSRHSSEYLCEIDNRMAGHRKGEFCLPGRRVAHPNQNQRA